MQLIGKKTPNTICIYLSLLLVMIVVIKVSHFSLDFVANVFILQNLEAGYCVAKFVCVCVLDEILCFQIIFAAKLTANMV